MSPVPLVRDAQRFHGIDCDISGGHGGGVSRYINSTRRSINSRSRRKAFRTLGRKSGPGRAARLRATLAVARSKARRDLAQPRWRGEKERERERAWERESARRNGDENVGERFAGPDCWGTGGEPVDERLARGVSRLLVVCDSRGGPTTGRTELYAARSRSVGSRGQSAALLRRSLRARSLAHFIRSLARSLVPDHRPLGPLALGIARRLLHQ